MPPWGDHKSPTAVFCVILAGLKRPSVPFPMSERLPQGRHRAVRLSVNRRDERCMIELKKPSDHKMSVQQITSETGFPPTVEPLATVILPVRRFTVDQYHRMIETGILGENDRV